MSWSVTGLLIGGIIGVIAFVFAWIGIAQMIEDKRRMRRREQRRRESTSA
jgi:hypothetical protein